MLATVGVAYFFFFFFLYFEQRIFSHEIISTKYSKTAIYIASRKFMNISAIRYISMTRLSDARPSCIVLCVRDYNRGAAAKADRCTGEQQLKRAKLLICIIIMEMDKLFICGGHF